MSRPLDGLDGANKLAQDWRIPASQRFRQGRRNMSATSIGRMLVPCLAVLAAVGAALFFAIMPTRRESPVEIAPSAAALAILPNASVDRDEGSATLVTAQIEANAKASGFAISLPPPEDDESVPVFDVARIDRTGDAVIAGRAAPGATVELLRGVEPYDRAVANDTGQFVMVPPRLPSGEYELTLRSRQPDGKQVTSKQKMVVALGDIEPKPGPDRSALDQPQPPVRQNIALQHLNATAFPRSDGNSPSAAGVPKTTHTIVSRGDSLWSISRAAYGAGLRYAAIYRANHNRIRNPDHIYPGQTLVLPR
jgi:nucleoid-associated protein YgaU